MDEEIIENEIVEEEVIELDELETEDSMNEEIYEQLLILNESIQNIYEDDDVLLEVQELKDILENEDEGSYKQLLIELNALNETILENNNSEEILLELSKINENLSNNSSVDSEQNTLTIVSSIQDDISRTNDYLYTINLYLAGFLVITMIMILIKALNGFMKVFL